MKFQRIDCDMPSWSVWSRVKADFKRDFYFAKALYSDFYCFYVEQLDKKSPIHTADISLMSLRNSLYCTPSKLVDALTRLSRHFGFEVAFRYESNDDETTAVVSPYDGETTAVQPPCNRRATSVLAYYPKLLEKQQIPEPWNNTIYGFKTKTKTNTNNPHTPYEGAWGETEAKGTRREAIEIVALILDPNPAKGKSPSNAAVRGLARDLYEKHGIGVIRDLKRMAINTNALGKVNWNPDNMRKVAGEISQGMHREYIDGTFSERGLGATDPSVVEGFGAE